MSWLLVNQGLNVLETSANTAPASGSPSIVTTNILDGGVVQSQVAVQTVSAPQVSGAGGGVRTNNIFRRPIGTMTTSGIAGTGTIRSAGYFAMGSTTYSAFSSPSFPTELQSLRYEGLGGIYMEAPLSSVAHPNLPTQFIQFGVLNPASPTAPQAFSGGMSVSGTSFFNGLNPSTTGYSALPAVSVLHRTAPDTLNAGIRVDGGTPGVTAYYINFASLGATSRGSIYTPGSGVVYATSSDYRLKTNISPLDPELELKKINELKPRSWQWKETNDPATGFIAHELQEVYENSQIEGLASGKKDHVIEYGYLRKVDTQEYVDTFDFFDETTQEVIKKPQEIEKPKEEELSELLANNKEWVKTREEPVYQSIDSSLLVSRLVASVQALSSKVVALEERVVALELA